MGWQLSQGLRCALCSTNGAPRSSIYIALCVYLIFRTPYELLCLIHVLIQQFPDIPNSAKLSVSRHRSR